MRITVRYYGLVTYVTDRHYQELEVPEGSTLGQIIDLVVVRYGEKIRKMIFLLNQITVTINRLDINDISIFPKGLDTRLTNGDIVSILGPTSGAA
ncbi:MAG: MoaD/ThiS family protein [Bacillota bacterium]|jgi:molybdopterin converting factor small subunit